MSISLAADDEELRVAPIIHIMAVLSLPDPLVSLKRIKIEILKFQTHVFR